MTNGKPTPLFSYEKNETADQKEADKIMLKIVKNALSKICVKELSRNNLD